MSWRGTLLLLLLAAGATTLAWRFHAASTDRFTTVARPLLAADELPVESVREVRVRRTGLPDFVLERRGGAWIETEPLDVTVDPHQVRDTILAARQLRWTRRIGAEDQSNDTGQAGALALDPPQATVVFSVAGERGDSREVVIHLGRLGVAGRAFVRRDDAEDVFVVGQELHRKVLLEDPRSWRERSIFPEMTVETTAIVLRAGDVRTELHRRGRQWQLTAPIGTRADLVAVTSLLQAIARAECTAFVVEQPDDLRPFGLDAPAGEISLRWPRPGGAEATRTLFIGGPISPGAADRYAMIDGRPLVMRISGSTLQSMFATAPALVEPTPAGGRPEDVRTLTVVVGESTHGARRGPLGWTSIGETGDDSMVDAARRSDWADGLLERLFEARATAISLQPYPEALHLATVRLDGFDEESSETIRIAIDRVAGQWATDAGDGVLRIHPIASLPLLPGVDATAGR